jgi:hypothetical protein
LEKISEKKEVKHMGVVITLAAVTCGIIGLLSMTVTTDDDA